MTAAWLLAGVWLMMPAPVTAAQESFCSWQPPVTGRTVGVDDVEGLLDAARSVRPGTTILLEDGEYRLPYSLDLPVPGTVVRSRSGDRTAVVVSGGGMVEDAVGVALSVSAPDVTIADLTVGHVRYHAIQVRGESAASRLTIHNVHLLDTGQQLLKGSVGDNGMYADDGLVACSRFEYSTHAPSDYTNGVDLLAVRGWTIRDNEFYRIRGPEAGGWRGGPAILLWANSQDTIVERNLIVDSFRGIAFGLGPGATPFARDGERRVDHQGGAIRNNVICNLNPWADESIEANAASGFTIEHNTVLTRGQATPWSIGIRFPSSNGVVRNNLTALPRLAREGGRSEAQGNVEGVADDWFEDASACNLRLTARASPAIDSGAPATGVAEDFDGRLRDVRPDAGAFEFAGGRAPRREEVKP